MNSYDTSNLSFPKKGPRGGVRKRKCSNNILRRRKTWNFTLKSRHLEDFDSVSPLTHFCKERNPCPQRTLCVVRLRCWRSFKGEVARFLRYLLSGRIQTIDHWYRRCLTFIRRNILTAEFVRNVLTSEFGRNILTAEFGRNALTAEFGRNILTAVFGRNVLTAVFERNVLTAVFWLNILTAEFGRNIFAAKFGHNVLGSPH